MKRIHLLTGILTLVVFLVTGVYMRIGFPELYGDSEAIRFLFRANHVYILFSGLLNVMAGFASVPMVQTDLVQKVKAAGSILLLLAAPLFILAFILEPPQLSPMRPVTVTAAFFALIGAGLFVLARKQNWKG
ncbi:MAG: hypothetical protein HY563_02075 [Ignavibacteriales bacterium]|nr:hypothetical protein [Ignavibacteriales bacterium]